MLNKSYKELHSVFCLLEGSLPGFRISSGTRPLGCSENPAHGRTGPAPGLIQAGQLWHHQEVRCTLEQARPPGDSGQARSGDVRGPITLESQRGLSRLSWFKTILLVHAGGT